MNEASLPRPSGPRDGATDAELEAWADAGEFRPRRSATGAQAAADGAALLAAAGVDVVELERHAGRPRIGGVPGPKGARSPRVHVAVSDDQLARLAELEHRRGVSRSELVREALEEFLRNAV